MTAKMAQALPGPGALKSTAHDYLEEREGRETDLRCKADHTGE